MTRFIVFALLGLITVGSSAADPPVVTLKGKQEGPVETFYQQVDIQRNPQFIVQGLKVDQQIHYQVTSSFDVYAADEKGNRKAVQTVNGAMLIKADPLSQAVFTQSLAEMRGRKFIFMISVTNHRMLKADKAQATRASGPSDK